MSIYVVDNSITLDDEYLECVIKGIVTGEKTIFGIENIITKPTKTYILYGKGNVDVDSEYDENGDHVIKEIKDTFLEDTSHFEDTELENMLTEVHELSEIPLTDNTILIILYNTLNTYAMKKFKEHKINQLLVNIDNDQRHIINQYGNAIHELIDNFILINTNSDCEPYISYHLYDAIHNVPSCKHFILKDEKESVMDVIQKQTSFNYRKFGTIFFYSTDGTLFTKEEHTMW